MKNTISILFTTFICMSCSTSTIKEKINKAGDAAGQAAGEFAQGASKGISKAFDVKISLPADMTSKGIQFGKAMVMNDSLGDDNMLVLYVIFNKDFEGKLSAKAFDDQSLEMGRASVQVNGKKDQAKYVEFHFDKRTTINSKNRITIE
jgi:hydrogenase maturation factor